MKTITNPIKKNTSLFFLAFLSSITFSQENPKLTNPEVASVAVIDAVKELLIPESDNAEIKIS